MISYDQLWVFLTPSQNQLLFTGLIRINLMNNDAMHLFIHQLGHLWPTSLKPSLFSEMVDQKKKMEKVIVNLAIAVLTVAAQERVEDITESVSMGDIVEISKKSFMETQEFKVGQRIWLTIFIYFFIQAIMGGVAGFWGGVFSMGSIFLMMVVAKRMFKQGEDEEGIDQDCLVIIYFVKHELCTLNCVILDLF